ncbi:MAG: helix-turn-helix domain-containing protein [Streptosporangiaceae bacterium]
MPAPDRNWAVWARVSPVRGHVLDLLHARMARPFAPHLHDGFSIGACIEGLEMIRYRGQRYYAAPGSVVILEPGEAHTGGPSDGANFVYRVMYPAAELLGDGAARPPRFPEPVVMDPALAALMRRVHAALGQTVQCQTVRGWAVRGTEPLEAESQLSWLFGELVRRHAAGPPGPARARPGTGPVARQVMERLADQLTCPPALAEIAAEAGLSRYQLLRVFRAEVGMPPYAWLAQHRVARARGLLERGYRPADAATLTGFADQAHLTRWFRRVVGVTPGAYRNGVQDSHRPDQ